MSNFFFFKMSNIFNIGYFLSPSGAKTTPLYTKNSFSPSKVVTVR